MFKYSLLVAFVFAFWHSHLCAETTIKVLSFRDNHTEAVKKRLDSFEKLTGIKVQMDLIAANTVATKIMTDQMAGGSYDLYAVDEPFIPKLSPFLITREQWPSWDKVSASDLKGGQFLSAAVDGTKYQGKSYGIPVNSNVYMYVYRKDLFDDKDESKAFKEKFGYDLAPPETTQQMRDIAEFFTRPPRMYGFAPFTKKSEGTTVEAIWALSTFGVNVFDKDLNVVMDDKKAVAAMKFYQDMMKFAPRGSKSWHHSERMAAYKKGKIAQLLTWPGFLKGLENPRKSRVVGKSGWGVPPMGPEGRKAPVAGTWALSIPKSSKKKTAAAAFAAYWVSSTFGKDLVAHGMNPARPDLLNDAQLVGENPWFPSILANFESAVVRPRFPDYRKVSDRISIHFTNMVIGKLSPEESVASIRRDLEALAAEIRKKGVARSGASGEAL